MTARSLSRLRVVTMTLPSPAVCWGGQSPSIAPGEYTSSRTISHLRSVVRSQLRNWRAKNAVSSLPGASASIAAAWA
jgi:hypothetical protein